MRFTGQPTTIKLIPDANGLPMLLTILILLFTGIMIGAIWLARRASDKHREEVERKQRARQIKYRLNEIAEISAALLRYDGNAPLLQAVTEFRLHQIRQRMEIIAGHDGDGELATAEGFKEDLPDALERRETALPTTDAEVNYMKKHLFKAMKLIRLMQSQGYMMETEAADHTKRLSVIMLKTEVNTYVQHGRQLLKDQDRMSAASYFKHAKDTLIASRLNFPERSSMIKRISKMISGIYTTEVDEDFLDEFDAGGNTREQAEALEEAKEAARSNRLTDEQLDEAADEMARDAEASPDIGRQQPAR